MIHKEVHYCHSNMPHLFLKCAPHTKRYYYVTLHFTDMINIFLSKVNDSLTLRLLMAYIYGAPSKARNANVVYIWTYVWQR